MKKNLKLFLKLLPALGIIFILTSSAFAIVPWMGTVVNQDTGNPIEGVLLLRSWNKGESVPGLGSSSYLISFKERFSDNEGNFTVLGKLPSLRSVLPFCWTKENKSIVYKPGYKPLLIDNNQHANTIELTMVPSIYDLRKKELGKLYGYSHSEFNAGDPEWYNSYDNFNFDDYLDCSLFKLIAQEKDFLEVLETSDCLVDVQPLIDLYRDKSRKCDRTSILQSLTRSRDERTTDFFIDLLNTSPNRTAINFLIKKKDPRVIKLLIGFIKDPTTRYNCKGMIKELAKMGASAVDALCTVVQDESCFSNGRLEAVSALGEIGDRRAIEPLQYVLQNDKSVRVRLAAAEVINDQFNDRRTVKKTLAVIALSGKNHSDREKAVRILKKIGYLSPKVLYTRMQNNIFEVDTSTTFVLDKTEIKLENSINQPGSLILSSKLKNIVAGYFGAEASMIPISSGKPLRILPTSRLLKSSSAGFSSEGPFGGRKRCKATSHSPGIVKAKKGINIGLIAKLQADKKEAGKVARLTFGKNSNPRTIYQISGYVAQLKHEDWKKRRSAVTGLFNLQDCRCTPWLISALQDSDKKIRLTAAEALGKIKHPLAIKYLVSALRDEDIAIRITAARILSDINSTIVLLPLVKTVDDFVANHKIPLVLVSFRDAWLEDQLIANVRNEFFEYYQNVLLTILEKISRREAADRIMAVAKTDKKLRQIAFAALARIGEPSIKLLYAAVKDENPKIREYAVRALGEIKDPKTVNALLLVLRDKNKGVRRQAVLALAKIKDPRAIKSLFTMSMHDKDSMVRRDALRSLKKMGSLRKMRYLVMKQFMQGLQDKSSYTRWRSAWALSQTGEDEAVDELIKASQDDVAEVRLFAAVALGEIGDPRTVAPLNKLANDRDLGIRSCAELFLAK